MMKRWRHHRDARIEQPQADSLTTALRSTEHAPDLTEPVMYRLGFRRIDEKTARRGRRRAWAGRFLVACAFIASAGAGVYMHQRSERARAVSGPTFGQALYQDLSSQAELIGAFQRSLGEFGGELDDEFTPQTPHVGMIRRAGGSGVDGRPASYAQGDRAAPCRHSRVPWSGLN